MNVAQTRFREYSLGLKTQVRVSCVFVCVGYCVMICLDVSIAIDFTCVHSYVG